jgi:hypothetical protein
MYYSNQAPKVPTANIAVNKSRLKVYKNVGPIPTYYLKAGTEFQIELRNPTTDVVLAKIILNGKAISQGGLVLNPGQSVWLERYLDVAKKFLFDTYEVSNSAEMKKAIEDNGDLKVEFYRESQPFNQYNGTLTINNTSNPFTYLRGGSFGCADMSNISLTGGVGYINNTTIGSSDLVNGTTTSSASFYSDNLSSNITLDSLSFDNSLSDEAPTKSIRSRKLSKTIETGRVEQGSESDQEFKYVNKKFEYFAFHTIEYKMLPVSQKINTVEDTQIKVYCTQCGSKTGKTDKFCSQCGNRI